MDANQLKVVITPAIKVLERIAVAIEEHSKAVTNLKDEVQAIKNKMKG